MEEINKEIEENCKNNNKIYCPNCGNANNTDATFCKNCGEKIIKYNFQGQDYTPILICILCIIIPIIIYLYSINY